jgi:tRNA(Ile)-lysidine synthase
MSNSFDIDFSPCKERKNLLAFSAGVDSTALYFLLLDAGISFDIAIVNYNSRESSKQEVLYAQKLAKQNNQIFFLLESKLPTSKMEETARKIRYDFFDTIIDEHHYELLLTAHQLNDQLEWFLMQLTKGAGSLELLGMKKLSQRSHYTLFKPLLALSKQQLENYLKELNIKYFIDESNEDQSLKRNYFRHQFSNTLLNEYQEGISKSFSYLQEDNIALLSNSKLITLEELTLIKADTIRARIFHIDKDLKRRGYILSHAQREEIAKEKSVVISNAFAIEVDDKITMIAPFKHTTMDKAFKELCRKANVPQKIRPYLYLIDKELTRYMDQILELLA